MTNTHLMVVKETLSKKLQEEANAIPDNFNQTRFLQNCLTVLQDTKDIDLCTPESIVSTMIKGAYLGLDFFNKECYAIVYNKNEGSTDKPKWVKDLQFQTDYKGEIKLAKKYCPHKIRDIYAKNVKEGDDFNYYVENGKQYINFRPLPFNDNKMLGSFAVVFYDDGTMLCDTMSQKEIEATREHYAKKDKSGHFSKAWRSSEGEMWKKTVLRRLCKLITLDFDNTKQKEAFEEGSIIDEDSIKETIDVTANSFKDPFKQELKKEKKPDVFSLHPSSVKTDDEGRIIE